MVIGHRQGREAARMVSKAASASFVARDRSFRPSPSASRRATRGIAARYTADRAFRQYDATDPANRLVAGELEARWNKALARVAEVESKIVGHDAARPMLAPDPASLATLATDLKTVWAAPTTDARLKKRIVRTLIQEFSWFTGSAVCTARPACPGGGAGNATAPPPTS
jgi:hypothetical protein